MHIFGLFVLFLWKKPLEFWEELHWICRSLLILIMVYNANFQNYEKIIVLQDLNEPFKFKIIEGSIELTFKFWFLSSLIRRQEESLYFVSWSWNESFLCSLILRIATNLKRCRLFSLLYCSPICYAKHALHLYFSILKGLQNILLT